jgi:hypothetical protein
MTEGIRPSDHGEQSVGNPQAFAVDDVEFRLVGETMVPREPAARDWGRSG